MSGSVACSERQQTDKHLQNTAKTQRSFTVETLVSWVKMKSKLLLVPVLVVIMSALGVTNSAQLNSTTEIQTTVTPDTAEWTTGAAQWTTGT